MAEPTSLTCFKLPLTLQKTHDGEQFLIDDFSPQDEDLIFVFATLHGVDILRLSIDWFCDGTFSTASNVFYQINTKHTLAERCPLPLVYVLLPDEKESTYCRLLDVLKIEARKRVTIGFEVVRSSITDIHQSAKNMLCCFHMFWRYVQSSYNTHNYNIDLNFREHIRTLLSTPFLPVEKSQLPSSFFKTQLIFNCFEDKFGRLTSLGRPKPRFDTEQWN